MKKKRYQKGAKQLTGGGRLAIALLVTNLAAVVLCLVLALIIERGRISLQAGGYVVYAIAFFSMLLGCSIAAGMVPEKRGVGIGILVGLELLLLVLCNLALPHTNQDRMLFGTLASALGALPVLLLKRKRKTSFRI